MRGRQNGPPCGGHSSAQRRSGCAVERAISPSLCAPLVMSILLREYSGSHNLPYLGQPRVHGPFFGLFHSDLKAFRLAGTLRVSRSIANGTIRRSLHLGSFKVCSGSEALRRCVIVGSGCGCHWHWHCRCRWSGGRNKIYLVYSVYSVVLRMSMFVAEEQGAS